MAMTGKNRIMIYAPENDGTYVVGYRIAYAEGEMRARYRHRSQSSSKASSKRPVLLKS